MGACRDGAWLMGSICMSVVATENFYTSIACSRLAPNAAFTAMVQKLGQPAARELLRYLSSELNRLYFQMWNVAQLVLGVAALWLLAGSRKQDQAGKCILAMLAIVVLMLVYLTPAIVSLGRELDFVPRDPAPPGMSRFWVLHAAYTSLEMLKLAVGLLVAGLSRATGTGLAPSALLPERESFRVPHHEAADSHRTALGSPVADVPPRRSEVCVCTQRRSALRVDERRADPMRISTAMQRDAVTRGSRCGRLRDDSRG